MNPSTLFSSLLATVVKLQKENDELRKEVAFLESRNIEAVVADRLDQWLNQPIINDNEREDVEIFARDITQYISSQLKNR